jgi:hypothetical protein
VIDPRKPSRHPAGSLRKQVVLRARARALLPLFDPRDCRKILQRPHKIVPGGVRVFVAYVQPKTWRNFR